MAASKIDLEGALPDKEKIAALADAIIAAYRLGAGAFDLRNGNIKK